jgi:type IV secretory pathway VirB6-like protein
MAADIPGTCEKKQRMMMHSVRTVVTLFLFIVALPFSVNAACNPNVLVGIAYCDCLMYPNRTDVPPDNTPVPAFAAPLFQCFTDTQMVAPNPLPPGLTAGRTYPRGIIPFTTYKILADSNIASVFRTVVFVLLSIAVGLFGLKMMLGELQGVKSAVFVLGLKIAGVIYFLANAPALYIDLLNIIVQLTDAISASASGLRAVLPAGGVNPNSFWGNCAHDLVGTNVPPSTTVQLWSMWDCTFNNLLGFAGANATRWTGLLTFAVLIAATLGTGLIIFLLIFYFLFALFSAFMRFMQTYLMAVMALSFIFLMGFMFVPLIFFKSTYSYFQKWMNYCLAYILTPMMMIGFMCMMLLAVDIVLFSGTNSLFEKIEFGSGARNYSTDQLNNPIVAAVQPQYHQIQFSSIGQVDHGNKDVVACDGQATQSGILSSARATARTGTASELNMPATAARIGLDMKGLHLTACDLDPGTGLPFPQALPQTPKGCTWNAVPNTGLADRSGMGGSNLYRYISGIFYALAVASLLAYIMHQVMGYLPTLVKGLVSQGGGAAEIAGAKIMGTDGAKNALNSGYSAVTNRAGQMGEAMKAFKSRIFK